MQPAVKTTVRWSEDDSRLVPVSEKNIQLLYKFNALSIVNKGSVIVHAIPYLIVYVLVSYQIYYWSQSQRF